MARGTESDELTCGFSLLSDPTRLGILSALATGPRNLATLCRLVRQKQQTISHHISLLRMGRLIIGARQGKSMLYTSDAAAIKALATGLAKLTPKK
ncbi:MAG: metalloregulator ArsR/SmtB family transcription factor [Planctomycetota bacterium]|nr:metalloregulator ArsR/SmtB family transcription factor [Planctomycetota bacterium]